MKKEKRDLEATKAELLEAAEKLMISCSDPSEATSRAITKEAGVNLSMLNYCFGSREALLFEAFGRIRKKAEEQDPAFSKIASGELSPKEKLIEMHFEYAKMLIHNYKYAKAVIKYVLLNRGIGAERGSLEYIFEHFGGRKTESECRLIAFEISAMHQLMILRYEDIKNTCGIDLSDDAVLRKAVEENINRFLD